MMVLALVDDMLFRSKIEATAAALGVSVRVVTDDASIQSLVRREVWQLAMVDLNRSVEDPLACVRTIRREAPTLPIVGYCSHGQVALHAHAQAAGCTHVLNRSTFVEELPTLLSGTSLSSSTPPSA